MSFWIFLLAMVCEKTWPPKIEMLALCVRKGRGCDLSVTVLELPAIAGYGPSSTFLLTSREEVGEVGFHSFFLKLISEVCQINKNALGIKAKYIISIIWGQGQVVNTPVRILICFTVGFGSLHRK